MEQSVKERLMSFLNYKGLSQGRFEKLVGFSNGYLDKLRHAPSLAKTQIIIDTFPELNRTWLLTGEGEMLNRNGSKAAGDKGGIPFYGKTLMCGSPADFDACIEENKAEGHIMLPNIQGDFALEAHGDSMVDAERPDRSIMPGAIVVLRKVADRSLLRWGEIYAIATADGFMIKKIMPLDDEHIECRSLNASEFPPFSMPKSDIFGFARVVAVISYKLY